MSDQPKQPSYPPPHDPSHGPSHGPAAPAHVPPPSAPTYLMREDYGYAGAQTEGFDLWKYFDVLVRRRWSIAAVFTVSVLAALVLTLASTPMFQSTALLQIQPNGPNILSFQDVQESIGQAQAYPDFFQTQYSILNSRALARRTIEKLDLASEADFNPELREPGLLARATGALRSVLPGSGEEREFSELEREHQLVSAFLSEIEIAPRRKSFLVELSFSSPSPELAAAVARTTAEEYIDLTLDQRIESASQGRAFIEKQLSKTKARLEQTEIELQEFARGRDIIALEQEESMVHARLSDLNERLTAAQGARIEIEAKYKRSKTPGRYDLPELVNSPLLKTLVEDLTTLEIELAQLEATFTDEYPEVKRLGARVGILRKRIRTEEDRLLASVHADYDASVERESMLRTEMEKQRQIVTAYEEKAIDFKIMRREVDTNRTIYEHLLGRLKEVEVTEAVRASNVTILDPAEIPLETDRPSMPLNMAFSLLIGVFGGVGLALLQEFLDDSVKTPDDVERTVRLPTLAAIPEFRIDKGDEASSPSSPDREVALQPTSAGAEAIRTLRASLFLTSAGGLPRRLLMTSARPGEGKTCISTNLAIALAQMGRRVVVIDCDLRKPRLHVALDVEQVPGLSNYLTGNAAIDEVIRPSGQAGLDVITAGPIPPNPVDLLDSQMMSDLLEGLEDRYDHILVDAPPSLVFADVPILTGRLGGGCLLVARSGETPKRALKQAGDYLLRMQSKVLGVVLNRVSSRNAGYSYYGYYGDYSHYYGAAARADSTATVEHDA